MLAYHSTPVERVVEGARRMHAPLHFLRRGAQFELPDRRRNVGAVVVHESRAGVVIEWTEDQPLWPNRKVGCNEFELETIATVLENWILKAIFHRGGKRRRTNMQQRVRGNQKKAKRTTSTLHLRGAKDE